jgi:hypothetical protein
VKKTTSTDDAEVTRLIRKSPGLKQLSSALVFVSFLSTAGAFDSDISWCGSSSDVRLAPTIFQPPVTSLRRSARFRMQFWAWG